MSACPVEMDVYAVHYYSEPNASAHWAEELVAHLGSVLFLIGDVFNWLSAFRIADCEHCDSDGALTTLGDVA